MKYLCILFTLGALLLFSAVVPACPMCNVHNYMYSSIHSASQIYVYAPYNSRTAVITQVLKGPHKVGERLKCKDLTSINIQCIPGVYNGMFFGEYKEHELEEIKWILSGDSLVYSDRQALQAILGTSNEFVSAAHQYIAQHHERMLPSLIKLADSLNSQVRVSLNRNYDWYLSNLHAVIFQHNNSIANNYAQYWISTYTEEKLPNKTQVNWGNSFYLYEKDFFESLLSETLRMDSVVGKEYAQHLINKIPSLGERSAAGVFYALLKTGYLDPYTLEKLIKPDLHNAFAYAVFRYDDFYNRRHTKEKAVEYNAFAFPYAEDPALKRILEYSLIHP